MISLHGRLWFWSRVLLRFKNHKGGGKGVLDNKNFQKGSNSSSGIIMQWKGGKRSSPRFSPQVGSEPRRGPKGPRGWGEGRGSGGEEEGSPRLAAVAPFSSPRTQGGGGVGCRPHLPISRTIKTTFKFFSPGLISFIKRGGSLTPFILRQVRLRLRRRGWAGSGTKLPTLPGKGEGAGETLGGGGERTGRKRLVTNHGNQPRRH